MNKKMLFFIAIVALVLSFISFKSQDAVTVSKLKKEAQLFTTQEKDKFETSQEINITDLSQAQLYQKLKQLEADIKNEELKNFSDFSESELQNYNQQVREIVRIKKRLFLIKYAHRSQT
jgi:hypothetical protein